MKIRRWAPDEIVVVDRIRKRIKEDTVLELMDSIRRIGLREPPTIRIEVDGDGCEDAILVAGLHRVEACKRLDLKWIDCVEFNRLRKKPETNVRDAISRLHGDSVRHYVPI